VPPYEPYREAEVNYDLKVKIPTSFGLSVEINITEVADFASKAIKSIINFARRK
jgi:hypothetical protein